MRAPLEFLNLKHQRRLFLVCLILSVLMLFMLQHLDRPIRTAVAPWGMVSFQLAGSMEESRSILQSWGAMGCVHAALSLGLDFLFLFFYSTAFSLACMLWSEGVSGSFERIRFFGSLFAWISLFARVFDGLENLALIQLLFGSEHSAWIGMGRWSALTKFGLLLTVMTWLSYVWILRLRGKH